MRQPGLGVRRFVLGFLALFLTASLFGIEAWPLTGWGLYSRRLTDREEGWIAVTVNTDGRENAVAWDRLPLGVRNTYRQLADVADRTPEAREPVCQAWAGAVRRLGEDVAAVRIYWTVVRRHFDGPSTVERRALVATCAERAA